jgi:peroxiredoxin
MKWRSLAESTSGADTRPLREQFNERKELIAKYVPAEAQAVHARVVAGLKRDGIADRVLQIGAQAPQFKLRDQNDRPVSSANLLSNSRLVICFFRGRWCPFCVGQLEAMNSVLRDIQHARAALVAISPQTVKQSFFMSDQHKLNFPLLSDPGNQVARQFGLVYRLPEDQKIIFRRSFINLSLANGDESWELPIPAIFIVERDGRIAFAAADPDYTERPEPLDIVEQLMMLNRCG